MTRKSRGMVWRVASTMMLALTACGSEEGGEDFTPLTGGAAGTSASGGTGAGTSGTAGSGAATSGSGGASAVGGSAGTSGGAGVSSGAGGSSGAAAGSGGTESAGTAGATAGSAGSAGALTGGAAGAGGGGFATAVFDIDVQLASDVDPDAPGTIGIVTWSVDVTSLVAARIEFGLDTTYGVTAPVDLGEAGYRTVLLGMKPERTYHLRVVAEDGTSAYASDDVTLETGPATDLVPLESFDVVDEAARERGFIVASYWQGEGSAVPFILDADGEIVWWFAGGPNGIARAVMSADGKNMWLIPASNTGGALVRVSMDTLDAETYADAVGSHDITPVSGATMAFIEYGESDCDSIYEIDPSGTTREVFESQGVVQANGCHGNALRYSKKEDVYTFSDVSQDILVIDRAGEVVWRLSERVAQGNEAWGGTQHGHHLLDESIVVFANRGAGMEASSVVEYSLTGEELLRYESGDFSANLGDVQRLPGGNTLVTFSNDSLIHEIDAEKNVVLAIDGGGSRFGYTLFRPTLYGEPPDIGQ
jgi:hypothetical protein